MEESARETRGLAATGNARRKSEGVIESKRRSAHLAAATVAALVVCLLLIAAVLPPPVAAHAELLDWQMAKAARGGQTLTLHYSELLDPSFVQVQIFDRGSRSVSGTGTTVDPKAPDIARVTLPSGMPAGTYRASWWVRSQDGDLSQNSFYFATSGVVDPVALLPPPDVRDPATSPPSSLFGITFMGLARWAGLVAALFVAGGVGYMMFLWGGVVPRGSARLRPEADLAHGLRVVCFEAATAIVFSTILLVLLQSEMTRLPLIQPAGQTPPLLIAPSPLEHQVPAHAVRQLLGSSYGRVLIARVALAVLVAVLGLSLPLSLAQRRWHWWLLLVTGGGMLLTFSLTAHGAVTSNARIAVAFDWTHLVAASVWLGGLPPLLLSLRALRRRVPIGTPGPGGELAPRLVGRFSFVALPAIGWLAISGVYAASLHLGSPALLAHTTYGVALSVKLALFVVIIALGAVSRYVLVPRLRSRGLSSHGFRFTMSLPIELSVGLALVVCVGLMLSLATAKDAWTAREQLGFFSRQQHDGVTLTLRTVDPSRNGGALAVDIADDRPGALGNTEGATRVTARLGGQVLQLAEIPVAVPGVRRFAIAGAGTALGVATQATIEYARASLPPIESTYALPRVVGQGGVQGPDRHPGLRILQVPQPRGESWWT